MWNLTEGNDNVARWKVNLLDMAAVVGPLSEECGLMKFRELIEFITGPEYPVLPYYPPL